MERFLFRVAYTDADGLVAYEPVCVRAADDDEAAALAEVDEATARYLAAVGGTRTITLIGVAADVQMRLAIGGPTRDSVPAAFAVDVAQLYAYTRERGPWWTDVTVGFIASTYIHVGREFFLEAAIKQGATHVLWLDTDMSVPRETAVLLSMHNQPIVACNYVVRQASGLFTAFRDEQRVPTLEHSTGLEAVEYCGMGAMLMRTDVVANLPRPWFRHGINDHGGDIGEDVGFCRSLRAAGHTIYLDHDLSKEIGHIGQHTYRIQAEAVTA